MKNHIFLSENGKCKITLASDFIAVSTVGYTGWPDFASWMDEPLGHFIRIYQPAFFERIGLRYVNGFSRQQLGLRDVPWRELIDPVYLGVLSRPDAEEKKIPKCSVDLEMLLDEQCGVRLHAGPGHIRRSLQAGGKRQELQEPEARFILDQDVFTGGKIPVSEAVRVMESLHAHAGRLFSEALLPRLHEAMEPKET